MPRSITNKTKQMYITELLIFVTIVFGIALVIATIIMPFVVMRISDKLSTIIKLLRERR